MRARQRQQRDLFSDQRKTPEVPAPLRSAILHLIAGLLVEALAGHNNKPSVAIPEIGEAAHEQDHS